MTILTIELLDALKHDVSQLFGWIKSSHRCEALGRGLGFKTYAACRAAAYAGSAASTGDGAAELNVDGSIAIMPDGAAFTSYLVSKGFHADASFGDAFVEHVVKPALENSLTYVPIDGVRTAAARSRASRAGWYDVTR